MTSSVDSPYPFGRNGHGYSDKPRIWTCVSSRSDLGCVSRVRNRNRCLSCNEEVRGIYHRKRGGRLHCTTVAEISGNSRAILSCTDQVRGFNDCYPVCTVLRRAAPPRNSCTRLEELCAGRAARLCVAGGWIFAQRSVAAGCRVARAPFLA